MISRVNYVPQGGLGAPWCTYLNHLGYIETPEQGRTMPILLYKETNHRKMAETAYEWSCPLFLTFGCY